jgi:hypothetical protein
LDGVDGYIEGFDVGNTVGIYDGFNVGTSVN